MRKIRKEVVYGKFGEEADIRFFQGVIENSLKSDEETKKEIHQLWKEIYQHRKKIEKVLKPLLKERKETRKLYEKKIEEIREKAKKKKPRKVASGD